MFTGLRVTRCCAKCSQCNDKVSDPLGRVQGLLRESKGERERERERNIERENCGVI